MARKILVLLLMTLAIVTSTAESVAWAQAAGGAAAGPSEGRTELTGTRRQVATIIFAGLAGAILGLSTLSFYGRPQDKLNNVAIGGAFGIIGGTIYTTYKSAVRPYDNFDVANDLDGTRVCAQTAVLAPALRYTWQF